MDILYISSLCAELDFPAEAIESLADSCALISEVAEDKLDCALERFETNEYSFDGMTERFREIEALCGVPEYTVALIFLLSACKSLERRYCERGYSRELFIATVSDIRYKLLECKEIKGIWGNFVYWWYKGFYDMTRFALGRFQYEKRPFRYSEYTVGGHTVRQGDEVLNVHIPSSGVSLNDEVRYESYRLAKSFFYGEDKDAVPFVCSSWLLWEDYEEYIPEGMNIKKFRRDFSIVSGKETEEFEDAWRIFGADAEKAPEELPRRTSQQRIFADYIMAGGRYGEGYGVFFFDGNCILGKDK